MHFKKNHLTIALSIFAFQATSAVLTSTNTTEASADTVAELVFVTDSSGSLQDSAENISNVMGELVKTLTCPNNTVYLRSEFLAMGEDSNYPDINNHFKNNTYFNKTIAERLGTTPINWGNFPDATKLIAENYPYTLPTRGSKGYVKGIVVISDGDTNNRVNQSYDHIFEANQTLIEQDTSLFIIGVDGTRQLTNFEDGRNAFKTMIGLRQQPAGTNPAGQGPFQDTGGTYNDYTSDAAQLEQDLQAIVCQAASVAAPTSTSPIPSSSVLTLLSLFGLVSTFAGFAIRRNQK